MRKRFAAIIVAVLAAAPWAFSQQPPIGTDDPVGPGAGGNYSKYNISQSWELGYRFASVGGDDGKYRSDVNYRNGIRLLDSSLSIHSLDGRGSWFDEIVVTTSGLGNDPYQSAIFRIQKNHLYRYDMTWRSNDYFNPGLTIASGEHLEDTTFRWQDHNLTLFPQSNFRVQLGYGRNTQDGPALTTEPEYTTTATEFFPIFRNTRQLYNEYRVGFDAKFSGFRFTILRRWEYFKEDSTGSVISPETGPAPPEVLNSFLSSAPYRGRTPSWMGNLNGEFRWLTMNARASYSGGKGDFAQNEFATGLNQIGATQNQQIAVIGTGDRPALTGDLNLTIFPTSRITIVNNSSVADNRMVGNNAFTDFDNGTLVSGTINFQYLNIRLFTNATDVRYKFSRKFDAFTGFRYADRWINSTEDGAQAGRPLSGISAEQSNHTTSGVAGANWLPVAGLRFHLEGEIGTNSQPFAPISQANFHSGRARVQYRRKNTTFGAGFQDNYNNNSIVITAFSSHARNYSADFSWLAKAGMSFDASYSKLHLNTIGGVAFFVGAPIATEITGLDSIYISNIHALNLGMHFALAKRADLYLGYNLTKDTGDGRSTLTAQPAPTQQVLYNVQTFPLTYQAPLIRLSLKLNEKLRWNAGYQYYGYHEMFGLLGQDQNYRANTGYTSLLWAF